MNKLNVYISRDDNYSTSKDAYELLKAYIPRDITIYDPFYCDGKCKTYMEQVFPTCTIINEDKDAFTWFPECDMIITNPPFSMKDKVLKWLIEKNKPFCCILPVTYFVTKKFCDLPGYQDFQFIATNTRIKYELKDSVKKPSPYYGSMWYCYGMKLPKNIQWVC